MSSHEPEPGDTPAASGPSSESNSTGADAGVAPDSGTRASIEERAIEIMRTCYDPEIPVNIYELGLIYDVEGDPEARSVHVRMTLTSPMCPVAESLPPEVEAKLRTLDGVDEARVEVVWEPPWNPGMMSEAAKLELGMM